VIIVVRPEGNRRAQELMYKYFEKADVNWRGIGNIPKSGLELRPEYSYLNAKVAFELPEIKEKKIPGCICDRVVLGKAYPSDCKLFKRSCTPRNPKGPCMVSLEGACNIWYRFGGNEN
jgi:hydrogenase expression/formation protein HypD